MCSLFEKAVRINNGFFRRSLPQTVEHLREACLVRITHGRFAIWLDPFGMLDPQVVVDLLPELGVRVNLTRRVCWAAERLMVYPGCFVQLGISVLDPETNEFHKRLSIFGLIAPNPRGTTNHLDELPARATHFRCLKAPSKSGDRVKRCLSEVKLSQPVFRPLKVRRDVGSRNEKSLRDPRILSRYFSDNSLASKRHLPRRASQLTI